MAIKNNPPEEVSWDALNYTYNDADADAED